MIMKNTSGDTNEAGSVVISPTLTSILPHVDSAGENKLQLCISVASRDGVIRLSGQLQKNMTSNWLHS